MIRWNYLLTRLIFVGVVLILLSLGLSPLAKWMTINSLQTMTGAKVELDRVDVGIFPPRLIYHNLQIANPGEDKALRNLAAADAIELKINGRQLLARRYVIDDAKITGLKFDSDRVTSGHLEPEARAAADDEPSFVTAWFENWIDSTTDVAKERFDEWTEGSEGRRRSDMIRRRWKTEYQVLTKRANDIEAAVKEIEATAKGIDNPLRDLPKIEATVTKVRDLQAELVSIRERVEQVPSDVRNDVDSMKRAKDADIKSVRDLVPFELAEGSELGSGLVRETIRMHVDQARDYLETGREVSKWTVSKPNFERLRGVDVDLDPAPQRPSLLVRRCELSGLVQSRGKPYRLTGILENITPQAELREKPLRARMRLDGDQVVKIDYTRDDSLAQPYESIALHWPAANAPTIQIGSTKAIDLDIRGGRLELWVELRNQGDQIDGRIVSRRTGTRFELTGDEKVQRTAMFQSLKGSLAGVDYVEVEARVHGDWRRPEFAISTNLTDILREGIREAAQSQIAASRQKLEKEVDEFYQEQLEDLNGWLAEQQQAADALLAKADKEFQKVNEKIVAETQKADAYLGKLRDKGLAETQRAEEKADAYVSKLRQQGLAEQQKVEQKADQVLGKLRGKMPLLR